MKLRILISVWMCFFSFAIHAAEGNESTVKSSQKEFPATELNNKPVEVPLSTPPAPAVSHLYGAAELGLASGLAFGYGLKAGYHFHDFAIEGEYTRSSTFLTFLFVSDVGSMSAYALNFKYFLSRAFFVAGGGGFAHTSETSSLFASENLTTDYDQYFWQAFIGSQWENQSLFIGVDWIGYMNLFSPKLKKYTSDRRANPDPSYQAPPYSFGLILLRFSVGLYF